MPVILMFYAMQWNPDTGYPDWQNKFAILTTFRYIKVILTYFTVTGGEKYFVSFVIPRTSLYRGSLNWGSTFIQ